jgi:NTE family protein
LINDEDRVVELLDSFWEDISANSFWNASVNNLTVGVNRLQGDVVLPQASPYLYPPSWQDRLRGTLEKHFPFGMLEELVKPLSPTLLVSAVDVLSGQFKVFRSHRFRDGRKVVNRRDDGISVDAFLASAALPTLVRAVHIGGGVYWDGLFSQNPP